jgi:hypothetical protein
MPGKLGHPRAPRWLTEARSRLPVRQFTSGDFNGTQRPPLATGCDSLRFPSQLGRHGNSLLNPIFGAAPQSLDKNVVQGAALAVQLIMTPCLFRGQLVLIVRSSIH